MASVKRYLYRSFGEDENSDGNPVFSGEDLNYRCLLAYNGKVRKTAGQKGDRYGREDERFQKIWKA